MQKFTIITADWELLLLNNLLSTIFMKVLRAIYSFDDNGDIDSLLEKARQNGFDVRPYRRHKQEVYKGRQLVAHTKNRAGHVELHITDCGELLEIAENYRKSNGD